MRFRLITFLSVFVLCIVLLGCHRSASKVTIHTKEGNLRFYVEVADTSEEKRIGLMGRTVLPKNEAMLFVYEPGSLPVMWMKDMLIPIDMLFISDDLSINHIENSVPPCEFEDADLCNRYSSFELSSYVLELPAGCVEQQGIEVGDRVELDLGL